MSFLSLFFSLICGIVLLALVVVAPVLVVLSIYSTKPGRERTPHDHKMAPCPNCGELLPLDASECFACGKPL